MQCHRYRIAFFSSNIFFTFQLPFQTAMPMMLTGKNYDAKRGKKIGLVDLVVEPIGKMVKGCLPDVFMYLMSQVNTCVHLLHLYMSDIQ